MRRSCYTLPPLFGRQQEEDGVIYARLVTHEGAGCCLFFYILYNKIHNNYCLKGERKRENI